MSQKQELMEVFKQVFEEGGRQELIESISEAEKRTDSDPIIATASMRVPKEEMAMMRVLFTDHLVGYVNEFLKSINESAYIHIKEIFPHHERIKLLEAFHNKAIDEIIEENKHLQEVLEFD